MLTNVEILNIGLLLCTLTEKYPDVSLTDPVVSCLEMMTSSSGLAPKNVEILNTDLLFVTITAGKIRWFHGYKCRNSPVVSRLQRSLA